MSGLWHTPDKPIQVTDREPTSTANVLPKQFAASASATSTVLSASPETRPCGDHEESPLLMSMAAIPGQDDEVGNTAEYSPQSSAVQREEDFNTDMYKNNPFFEYRNLVGSISEKLRKENALRLAYVYALPEWYYEVGPTHDPTSALRIIMALEGKGVFAPNNLAGLTKALETIEREDLAQLVRDFRSKVAMETVAVNGRSNTVSRQAVANRGSNCTSSSCQARPSKPIHSISTTSLMHDRPVEDTNIYTGDSTVYRTQSKPELEKYQVLDREALNVAVAGSSNFCQPSVESLTHGGQEGAIGIGLQFTLMSARTLEDQIFRLTNHFTSTYHQASLMQSPSTVKSQVQSLLDNARSCVARSTANLERVSDILGVGRLASAGEPPSSARSTPVRDVEAVLHHRTSTGRFSRSSSQGGGAGIPMSRQSSGLSTKAGAAIFVNPLSSSGGMDARKQLTFDQSVEKDSSTSSRRHTRSGYTKLTQEDLQEHEIAAPFPGHMHPTPPANQVKIKRKWSRRDEKKLSRKGVLVWQLKVKRLKEWYSQKTVSLSSEDFYDVSKRKFKATLHPFGLGPDEGSYMTLCINCLDEMKSSQKLQTTDIIVSVLDPQSTEMPLSPICRQLERRGIRVIQQFISHAQVDKFLSDVIVVTIALTVKRSDQEATSDQDSDSEEGIV